MSLFEDLNDIAPNTLGSFIREYEATKNDIPLLKYPDPAFRGLILSWLQDFMDLHISEVTAHDLFSGSDMLIRAFKELEKEYIIK